MVDGYAAVWLFTANPEFWSRNTFFPGVRAETREPVEAFLGHLSYDFKQRLWASLDADFWFGGRTTLNGIQNVNTYQKNSRIGATVSVPISNHQSVKFSCNNGDYVRYGGN